MKTKLLSLFTLSSLFAAAQNPIPNPGFENWNAGNPVGWTTNNIAGLASPVIQSSNSHSGISAARLEVVNFLGNAYPPVLDNTIDISVNQDYPSFSFYFKGILNSNYVMPVSVRLENNANINTGTGAAVINSTNSTVYTYTSIPIIYTGSNSTDASIEFALTSITPATSGSYLIIDDLNFETSVGLDEKMNQFSCSLGQVYPNPVEEIGLIPFSLSKGSKVSIELFSTDGKKVLSVLDTELGAGKYKVEVSASQLSSGVYLCKLSAEDSTIYKKLTIK